MWIRLYFFIKMKNAKKKEMQVPSKKFLIDLNFNVFTEL